MRIIIAPAKKMTEDTDSLAWRDLPQRLPEAQYLLRRLRGMRFEELKALWKCSDRIARQNAQRLEHMDLCNRLTPAILAYEGIQYQHMAPGVFTYDQLDYVQQRLRILSGFYGILRPFDGVQPYRLEMQAGLKTERANDLYGFWGDSIARSLLSETDCILNLASREYSRCVSAHPPGGARMITCVFGEQAGGRVIEKGTLCKMARGEMVRFMAENGVDRPEGIRDFDRLGFRYAPEASTKDACVFLRSEKQYTAQA